MTWTFGLVEVYFVSGVWKFGLWERGFNHLLTIFLLGKSFCFGGSQLIDCRALFALEPRIRCDMIWFQRGNSTERVFRKACTVFAGSSRKGERIVRSCGPIVLTGCWRGSRLPGCRRSRPLVHPGTLVYGSYCWHSDRGVIAGKLPTQR